MHGTRLFTLLGVSLISCATGCGAARFYSGPARTPDEISIIRTIDPSLVTRIDEEETSTKVLEVLPGRHSVEFVSEAGPRMGKLPILRPSCYVSFEAVAGSTYSYSARIDQASAASGRDASYHWTIFSADPQFSSDDGIALPDLVCESTCRIYGRRGASKLNLACSDQDKSPLDSSRDASTQSSDESTNSVTLIERVLATCDSRGKRDGIGQAMCLSTLVANPILYRLPTGEMLYYFPSAEARIRPGLRGEARRVCGEFVTQETASECLSEFGWELSP